MTTNVAGIESPRTSTSLGWEIDDIAITGITKPRSSEKQPRRGDLDGASREARRHRHPFATR